MKGQDSILGTCGPMGRSVRDLELFIDTILAASPWNTDPACVKMPWRKGEVVFKGGETPRVGVMWDDGVVRPQPPMRRALAVAVMKLRAADIEVVDYAPYKSAEAWEIIVSVVLGEGLKPGS